jgi:hypothetical protein
MIKQTAGRRHENIYTLGQLLCLCLPVRTAHHQTMCQFVAVFNKCDGILKCDLNPPAIVKNA